MIMLYFCNKWVWVFPGADTVSNDLPPYTLSSDLNHPKVHNEHSTQYTYFKPCVSLTLYTHLNMYIYIFPIEKYYCILILTIIFK